MMLPVYLDSSLPGFPEEPDLPEPIVAAMRAGVTGWLNARLEELEGDCYIRTKDEEAGTIEALFPAMPAPELRDRLAEKGVYCALGEKHTLRFQLSAGQAYEPLDSVQAVLMEILGIE